MPSHEAFGFCDEGAVERVLSRVVDGLDLAIVDLIGGHQAEAGMMRGLVVPVEEASAKAFGIFDATEALWKLGLVFERFEVAFRKRGCR